jgi:hypothetical protein
MNTQPPRTSFDPLADLPALARRTRYRLGMLIELDNGHLRPVSNLEMFASLRLAKQLAAAPADMETLPLTAAKWSLLKG